MTNEIINGKKPRYLAYSFDLITQGQIGGQLNCAHSQRITGEN